MYIVVCDDQIANRRWIKERVEEFSNSHAENFILKEYADEKGFFFDIEDIIHDVDLVYLQVQLRGTTNGFEVAERLRCSGYTGDIVFICDKPDYALIAFDYGALNYLVSEKTTDERFSAVLERAYGKATEREKQVIILACAGERRVIALDEIRYFEILKRIVTVHYGKGETFEFYSTIYRLEQELTPVGFLRTHKSYLVNKRYVSKLTARRVLFLDGTELQAGQGYIARIKK